MARILIAWEFGGGLGHVGPSRVVGEGLVRQGHSATIASANVPLCMQAMRGAGVRVIAAPQLPESEKRLKIPCTYSDLLYNAGYSSAEELTATVGAWLEWIDQVNPGVLLADYSPTAMLAARIRCLPTVVTGTGFVCPPDISPLPSLHPIVKEPHWAAEVEATVLANMNAALTTHGGRPLDRVGQLLGDADRRDLITLPELDHYPGRTDAHYLRPFGSLPGISIDWPPGDSGPRVFIYLRNDPATEPILQGLAWKQIRTIAYVRGLPPELIESLRGSSVKTVSEPINLRPLMADCDLVIHNGGHTSVCGFLLAGVPMLVIPRSLEQELTGHRIAQMGVGHSVAGDDLSSIAESIEELLENPQYTQQAQAAAHLANHQTTVSDWIESLVQLAVSHD